MSIITKLFGTRSEREVKKLEKIVEQIDALEGKYKAMSEAELQNTTVVLRARLANGETLDDLLPDAYAAVREASSRVLKKRHYKVQLIGGIILHQGRIAEMKTGEGKTLMATLPCYLNALTGKGVHVVTVNDYLAKRDSEWMGKVYNYLGMTVGLIVHEKTSEERKEAYNADITYGTNNELGFDYLRDNMATSKAGLVQREHNFAIVDEVDSILIDEARTPLIISGPGDKSTELYVIADKFAKTLSCKRIKEMDNKADNDNIGGDYVVDEKAKTVVLTADGIRKAESYFHVTNLSDPENATLQHHINQAIRAHGIMQNEVDYTIKDGEVMIVDQFTGRIMPGRRYSNGLHQAIEAKEGVKIQNESKTLATITFQNFFRIYNKLSGMTGTALTEEDEFREIYALDVVEVPTNRPLARKDCNDEVYKTVNEKYTAVINQIIECHKKGQPVLVGTVSIDKSEYVSALLKKNGVPHNVLNAKYHEKEAEIVAQAGKLGAVTIATNMAGRGTDIMLGGNPEFMAKNEMRKHGRTDEEISLATSYFATEDEEILKLRQEFNTYEDKFKAEIEPEAEKVREAGGLYIIGTERHDSRRIDNQLRGRAGRQGDPGCSKFYLSLQDDLMRLFGGQKMEQIFENFKLPEGEAINASILSGGIERAQKTREGMHFNSRKTVLQYDDVMNVQRQIIYKQRQDVLHGVDIHATIVAMVKDTVNTAVDSFVSSEIPEDWNLDALRGYFFNVLTTDEDFRYTTDELNAQNTEKIREMLLDRAMTKLEEKAQDFGSEDFGRIERAVLLRNVDNNWIDHIDAMDDLKDGISLRSYGSKDPLNEYRLEGADMFDEMIATIKEGTTKMILSVVPTSKIEQKDVSKGATEKRVAVPTASDSPYGKAAKPDTETKKPVVLKASEKIGRNDPCPCGSGKKYKKCCGAANAEGADEGEE
ncbi:MAG: preprotein translocase subunit SecA [Clostridia bacterium]|nr:preprotein translocase subunit SecA [Clostridia bacterium]